ncbi:MAG: hypothetical protein ACFFCW_04670 [Candidatus Hodarchaeota archaeon]
MSGSIVKKIQEPVGTSKEVNENKSMSISSVDTTSVLSLLKATITLLYIKIKYPRNTMNVFIVLSITIPLSTLIFRLVGRFTFWIFWLLAFYGTIWAFGYFNKSNCDMHGDLLQKDPSLDFYITRKMFLAWFLFESFMFLTIGWYLVRIRGREVLLIVYFLLFAAGGLIYGLGDVTCPHCHAINAGRRIKTTEEYTDYRCCICMKEFSHIFSSR